MFQACWLHVFMFQTVKKHRCFTNHSSTLRNLKDLLRHTSVHTFSFVVASMLHVLLRLVKLGSGIHHFQIRVFSFLVGIFLTEIVFANNFCFTRTPLLSGVMTSLSHLCKLFVTNQALPSIHFLIFAWGY